MRLSTLFSRTRKDVSEDEISVNARLLTRAGFIEKTMAGVYSYLPLGALVIRRISEIVRDEMRSVGGQEIILPALHPREFWEATGRWDELDVLFKVPSRHGDKEYALGPSHEEVVVPLAQQFIHSYRDVPRSVFQIQTKFRDEPRAKSGILRGREFLMKDMYSFHADEHDMASYYEVMKGAYARVFERCGLSAVLTEASGGTFSEFSHEYQVFTEFGEDVVFYCACGFSVNREIARVRAGDTCPACSSGVVEERTAIEVGNIFMLHRKYSDPFRLLYAAEDGSMRPVYMGCYGIGISRLMGAIAEVHHDERGLRWPDAVAPAMVHVVRLGDSPEVIATADHFVSLCEEASVAYVYDDRGLSAGVALGDADLMGLPYRVVVSERSLANGGVEVSRRADGDARVCGSEEALSLFL